jgi:hypothetical protein
MLLRRNPFH